MTATMTRSPDAVLSALAEQDRDLGRLSVQNANITGAAGAAFRDALMRARYELDRLRSSIERNPCGCGPTCQDRHDCRYLTAF